MSLIMTNNLLFVRPIILVTVLPFTQQIWKANRSKKDNTIENAEDNRSERAEDNITDNSGDNTRIRLKVTDR